MITTEGLRKKYFDFFQAKGHTLIYSSSILPENDPTVLFTTAGMHPLVPYLLGEKHISGTRLVNVQKCIRTGDIDAVGNSTHLTFFEMLGNWSLGDYFKAEMIAWSWEFLTDKKWLGIDPNRLFITVYEGDAFVPRDDESIDLWQGQFAKAGIEAKVGDRIFPLGREDNWWGPAGRTGPCGPDTEMFYDTGQAQCGSACRPGCACGKYVEIWNDVFMEYNKQANGSYEALAQKNVDTGMGIERTVAVLNGYNSVFAGETLKPIIEAITSLSGKSYEENKLSFRIVADHVRTAALIASDGVVPGNVEQGYVLRRLIRRAIRHGRQLGIKDSFLSKLAEVVYDIYADVYQSVKENHDDVVAVLDEEEKRFSKTLDLGLEKFNALVASEKAADRHIAGPDAFDLFATYGFPLEITEELAREQGLSVDSKGFYEEFNKHQELSRTATAGKFAGGLADHSETAKKYHTATHLLHAALRRILQTAADQRGSNITDERLRFDFNYGEKLTPEQIKAVEDLVNAAIARDYPVSYEGMTKEDAYAQGAIGLFEAKYGEWVKVYTIGDPAEPPVADVTAPTFSKEICGGPHVEHTGALGKFKIQKEEAVSSGVRRIKAILE